MSVLCFENISYKYPRSDKFALEGINLTVGQGEFFALMGENGAGKTTLCRLVNGIIPHFSGGVLSGIVTTAGKRTSESSVSQLALNAGMVLDDPDAQIFTSTVRDEAAFGPENLLLPAAEINERVKYSLGAAGLAGFEDRAPSSLSAGEKQRLSIAAALAMKGTILVLDEPLRSLDPQGAAEVMCVLKDLCEKRQITVVMAAHESAVVHEFADRVCVLKEGRIKALDTAKNIFADGALLEECGIQPPCETFNNKTRGKSAAAGEGKNKEAAKALEIKDFCFSYKDGMSFENINFSIDDNEIAAVVGNNGCGKTTLLKNITGLLRPLSGKIYLRGRNIYGLCAGEISKEIGFVMQNPDSQLFTDSVFKEAAFALKNRGLPKEEIKKRVEEALKTVGIEEHEAFPHSLSRDGRKKLITACVLAAGCRILIFDEIDLGLDYKGILKIMDIVNGLKSRGFTIIFVTHNISLAEGYADKIIKLERNSALEIKRG